MRRTLPIVLGLLVLALAARAGLSALDAYDYFADASTPIDALARGDLHGFAVNQSLMGSFSILLRAPFVVPVYHADLTTVFVMGAIPCLMAAVALGMALRRVLEDAGASRDVQATAAALAVINPLTFRALHWGHPEEILTAALCVGAVLAAMRERQLMAGILLGLALASKQWALLAVLPALLAAPQRRLLVASTAGVVAAALTVPLFLLAPDQATGVANAIAGRSGLSESTTPWNLWWPLAHLTHVGHGYGTRYLLPDSLARLSHPLIVLSAVPLSAAVWLRRDRRPDDALLLLALLFLLRCVLDHWNNDYYHVPLVLSLLAWETVRTRSFPVLSMATMAALGLTFFGVHDRMYEDSTPHAALSNAVYLGWTIPLLAFLGVALYRPRALAAVARRWPTRRSPAAARPDALASTG